MAMVLVAIVSSIICVALGPFAEKHFGKKDPGQVTIDEWAGQAVALLGLPVASGAGLWITVAAAFVAFRVFDIVKPPPARQLEKLPHGWGVLLDDLAAGVYANIVCQVLLRGGFLM
jgi:phosphatidylglycerophosphatase A